MRNALRERPNGAEINWVENIAASKPIIGKNALASGIGLVISDHSSGPSLVAYVLPKRQYTTALKNVHFSFFAAPFSFLSLDDLQIYTSATKTSTRASLGRFSPAANSRRIHSSLPEARPPATSTSTFSKRVSATCSIRAVLNGGVGESRKDTPIFAKQRW